MQINSKEFRTLRAYRQIHWTSYRSQFAISSEPTLEEFISSLTQARSLATEEVTSTADVDCYDSHMFQLLRKADRLTKQYRAQGKRHHHLMQLKRHYRIIREYQVRRSAFMHLLRKLETLQDYRS